MRIGLVIERMIPSLGGAEQWTYQFARWLIDQAHDVHVVAQELDPSLIELGIVAHKLDACRTRIEFAEAARRTTTALALDVVHDMGRGWHCDVFHPHNGSRYAAFERNLQMEPPWKRPLKRLGQRLLPRYHEFDRLLARQYTGDERIYIAVSQMVAQHFEQYHGISPERIRQIYNGVDIARFSPSRENKHRAPIRECLGVHDDEIMLLLVAHNLRLKGLSTLLHASAILAREAFPIRLVVVGGKRFGYYQRLARHLGIAEKMTLAGPVHDPAPYYSAADIYVQPTYYDPCSLVVLEAMACQLPVITTRCNGVSELMTDGVDGRLFDDPSDGHELAASLRPLMDASAREAMGRAARKLAEAHPLERNFQEIVEVYREVAAARRRLRATAAPLREEPCRRAA